MKNIKKIACFGLLGAAFVITPTVARAACGDSCCGAVTPLAEKSDAAKTYPLDTCVVSGEKLGEMGKPYTFDYKGQEVQLCCKDCKKKFDKDPEKFMKKIEDAKAKK